MPPSVPSATGELAAEFRNDFKSIVYLPSLPKGDSCCHCFVDASAHRVLLLERSTHEESRKSLRGELNALIKMHLGKQICDVGQRRCRVAPESLATHA